MLNALRLVDGFDATLFAQRTGLDWVAIAEPVNALVGRELLLLEGGRYKPSPRGLQFLNELLLSFMVHAGPESAQTAGAF